MTLTRWLEQVWPGPETIPFHRFMELCLYHPQHGYYERDTGQIGVQGDFLTSLSAGPLFGQLLACQFVQWARRLGPGPVQFVEAGAHDGTLARDILAWLARYQPALEVQYWVVEPSKARQQEQERRLEYFAGQVRWVHALRELPSVTGLIFSNELLDAFPVRRLGWDGEKQAWFEWGVSHGGEQRLRWVRLPRPHEEAVNLLEEAGLTWSTELGQVLPDGYTVDLCPAAADWWGQAAAQLSRGRLVTVDYGLLAEEMFAGHRLEGTLRAYQGHRQFSDVLEAPGERDLTAHVNFTQLIRAGERAGLRTDGLFSQERFLMGIVREAERLYPGLVAEQTRQLQTLAHPDRAPFRVLIQRRESQASSA